VRRVRRQKEGQCLAEGGIERGCFGDIGKIVLGKNMTRIENRQKRMRLDTDADCPEVRGDLDGSRAVEGSWNP
jgi:hypothetical protein